MKRKIIFMRRRIKALLLDLLKRDLLLLPKVKVPVVEYGSDYGAWGLFRAVSMKRLQCFLSVSERMRLLI